jgi:hypothetical protein
MGSRRGFVLGGLATVLPVAKARALPPPLDWSVDSPDSQGISGATLEKVLDSGETVHGLQSLVVVRRLPTGPARRRRDCACAAWSRSRREPEGLAASPISICIISAMLRGLTSATHRARARAS